MTRPLAICLLFCGIASAATASSPNIVYIMSDDMGYSDIGCYGGEIDTPNLERAGRGRPAIHAVLQHRPLLPDPGVAADGTVSAPGRRGAHDGRPRPRRLPRRSEPALRDDRRGAADGRLS